MIWVILLLLAMLAILSYAVQGMMVEFHVQAHRLALEDGAQALALSGIAAGAARVRADLGPGGALREQVLSGTLSPGTLTLDVSREIALLTSSYPGATLSVSAQLGTPVLLTGKAVTDAGEKARLTAGRGWDPAEVRFPVTITAEARWGTSKRSLTETREGAVVDIGAGTLGRFTLWARNVLPAGADGYAGAFDGAAAGPGKPLVLHNGGAAPEDPFSNDPQVYKKRGHVWLGGDQALKVSAGYLGFGETWTFLPMEELSQLVKGAASDQRSPPVYVDADPPDFFQRTYPPPDKPPPPFQRFEIRHMITGFYAGADNRGRKLADIFPGEALGAGPSFGMSSRLHLFGTAETPSPTLVLGRVRRRYPALTAVLVDGNDDGVPDGLVGILPQLDGVFPAGMPPVPARAPAVGQSGTDVRIDNEGEITWPQMFTPETYPTFASQIEDRPYMEAYSFLYRTDDGTKSFYPEPPLFSGFVEELTLGPAENPFYSGRPEALNAADLLEKATYHVSGIEQLKERFATQSGELALDGVVEVAGTPGTALKLSGLRITRPGTLILTAGDIEVGDLTYDAGLALPLTLVALAGNVKIDRGDETAPLPLAVIAPQGRLIVSGSGPVALEGALAVDTLDLDSVAGGGHLYYDTQLDPTSVARRERYRVHFSDAPIHW